MQFLFLLDPVASLFAASDTSLAIAESLLRRGHRVAIAQFNHLFIDKHKLKVRAQFISSETDFSHGVKLNSEEKNFFISDFAAVLIRKNPPYDQIYHTAMLLLEQARGETFFFNDPRGLRNANEKLATLAFSQFNLDTFVSANKADLKAFSETHPDGIVLKPCDGFGGEGIFLVKAQDPNLPVILDMMTHRETRWVIAQPYLHKEGDKRILVLDGKPIGALMRYPQGNSIASNLRAGGKAAATTLTDRDQQICNSIKPFLKENGLHFVGLDILGGYLNEINITSPTGIRAINQLNEVNLQEVIVDFLERSTA